MGHELVREFGVDERDFEWLEVEIKSYPGTETLNATVGDKVAATWSKQDVEGRLAETEDYYRKRESHSDDAEEHLSQYFKMPSEGH